MISIVSMTLPITSGRVKNRTCSVTRISLTSQLRSKNADFRISTNTANGRRDFSALLRFAFRVGYACQAGALISIGLSGVGIWKDPIPCVGCIHLLCQSWIVKPLPQSKNYRKADESTQVIQDLRIPLFVLTCAAIRNIFLFNTCIVDTCINGN